MLSCSAWTLHGGPRCHDTSPTCIVSRQGACLVRSPSPRPVSRKRLSSPRRWTSRWSRFLPSLPHPPPWHHHHQPLSPPPPSSVPIPESTNPAPRKPLNVDGARGRVGAHLWFVCPQACTSIASTIRHSTEDEALDTRRDMERSPPHSFWPFNAQDARATRRILTTWRGKTGSPACQGLQVGQALCRPVLVETREGCGGLLCLTRRECLAAAELESGRRQTAWKEGSVHRGKGLYKEAELSNTDARRRERERWRWVMIQGGDTGRR
jgi:hypothetical protein